jgi:tetratricopeptide (TPR) repeat protein
MAWDDMNLASAVARDSLAALEERGDSEGAREGYRLLLTTLSSQRAVNEIDWRLAIVDYNLGEAEAAVTRLQALVARTGGDEAEGIADSTHVRYRNDYGTLCLNLGRDFLYERKDNRTALKYFEQAARVAWSGQPVAYLEIASLVQGNVELALENASRALAGEADFTIEQRKDLYRLLMGLYRRSGNYDQARQFRDAYRSLEER